MLEDIAKMLQIVGHDLTFPISGLRASFVIQVIPGFELTYLANINTVYDVENPIYTFVCATLDIKNNLIILGDIFTIFDGAYTYTMQVATTPIPYLDGWSHFTANYTSKV